MLSSSYARKLLPLSAFLLFSTIALVLWQNQNRHDRELVARHTETSAEQARIRVEGFMGSRLASLEMLADRWVEREPPDFSHQRFLGFAEVLYRRYPGYSGVFWIDPEGAIQWVFPENEHSAVTGKKLSEYPSPQYSSVISAIRNETNLMVMPCVPLHQGEVGFHVLRALIHKNEFQGYLDGVFKIGQIMDLCLPGELLKDFSGRVYEENRIIYRFGDSGDSHEASDDEGKESSIPRAVREIRFAGKTWTLRMEPTPAYYRYRSVQNIPLMVFGLALSAALSLALYFLVQRMEMLKASRDEALREVSERKRAQEALRRNEKKLEALLAELTAKNAELETFVYTVSHDLKTPIVTIEGFIGALREDFGELISESGERYLQYMSDAARKMENLISDLLNLSRIGRVAEKETRFSLAMPVEDAVEMLRPQIEARSIAIDVQKGLPAVLAERKRIGQVMDNLLSNAVKYIGKDNPAPRIEIGCEVQDGMEVFFVRDNGIGIEERYFDKIFQLFQRLPPAKLAGDGTGMGLTIVKRIIEHHGGGIWLTSEPGKGTTFYFTLKDKKDKEAI